MVVLDTDGNRVPGKQVIADLMWQVATLGHATFPNGKQLSMAPQDWMGAVKWIYSHIDGAAKPAELDDETDTRPLVSVRPFPKPKKAKAS